VWHCAAAAVLSDLLPDVFEVGAMTPLACPCLIAVLFPLLLTGAPLQPGQERPAIVQIGGCTGVCVDPAGLVMTAKHCDLQEIEVIRAGGREFTAVRIYAAPGTEGPLVYDVLGDNFVWIPVAQVKPEPGETVRTLGLPAVGGSRQFRELTGVLEGGAHVWYEGEQFLGNITDIVVTDGWSGGPLLNSNGEVVGLANSSGEGVGSVFISHAATREAYLAARALHSSRPQLQVLISPEQKQSLAFQRDLETDIDFQRELREHFRLLLLDARQQHPPLERFRHAELPVFIFPDGQAIAGYDGKLDLIRRLLLTRPLAGQHSPVQEY
jgi:S1-C subfamily serine protease